MDVYFAHAYSAVDAADALGMKSETDAKMRSKTECRNASCLKHLC